MGTSTFSTSIRPTLVPQEEPQQHDDTARRANVLQVLETQQGVSIVNEELFLKGEAQPLEYRDRPFAIAFLVQLVAIVGAALALGPAFLNKEEDGSNTDANEDTFHNDDNTPTNNSSSSGSITFWLLGTCLSAVAIVGGALVLLMKYPHQMIRVSFFAAPCIFVAVAALTAMDPELRADGLPVVYSTCGAAFGLLSLCWYLCFRRYMPFAAANLRTALAAVNSHKGLFTVSLGTGLVSTTWIVTWTMALFGMNQYVSDHNPQVPCTEYNDSTEQYEETGEMCDASLNPGIVVLLLLCLHWSHQVIQNVLHVTTAGTVGTWWFTSDDAQDVGLCGCTNVGHSLCRASTYSFGSICLGSLLVAILQTLENMLKSQRRNRRGNAILLCVLECLAHLLRRWMEFFNSWAFVYVGLYGYDYITAGKNVVNLFKSTGWTTFIADRLVYRVMVLCRFSIGILAGCASLMMDRIVGPVFLNADADSDDLFVSHLMAFFLGMFLGFSLSSTALFVVESAVRTVIVCFAESAGEFQLNHPEICNEMTQGWSETYPEAWEGRRQATVVPMASATVSGQESERLV